VDLIIILHLLNLHHHGGRLGMVHDRLDRTFIPEVAIQAQVENIFKMSWSYAITKVAQHNLSPTEQALNNVSGRV
jgi:hypothetical protein